MQQVLLTVVAAVILGYLGLSRHQSHARDERASMVRELEAAALSLAEQWSGEVRALAFDEADLSRMQVRLGSDLSGLTSVLGPEAGEDPADPGTFDDADDFNGYSVVETAPFTDGTGAMQTFQVRLSVSYADPTTWAPSTTPKTAKIATVTVEETGGLAAKQERPPVTVSLPVRLTPLRQFSYQ